MNKFIAFLFIKIFEILLFNDFELMSMFLIGLELFAKCYYIFGRGQRFQKWDRWRYLITTTLFWHLFQQFVQTIIQLTINLINIILLMSLLTSSATTREQHRFFNKMERQFNKRTFYNANYIQPKHPLQVENQNSQKFQELIRENINEFLANLKKIFTQGSNNKIDYYYILTQMKSLDFFNEVANMIQESILQKNSQLFRQNQKLKEELKKTHQQLRQFQRSERKVQKSTNNFKLNSSKTIAQNLYEKAKSLSETQFVELCNKVILGQKIVIKKVSEGDFYKKWDDLKGDRIEQKQLLKRIDAYFDKKVKLNLSQNQQELKEILLGVKKYSFQKQKVKTCPRPCCNAIQENVKNESKALRLRKSLDFRKESQIYKNDKSQEYFNRYYRKSEFDMHKIYSIQKTKLEEMQKIEDDYRVTSKMRKKINYSQLK